MFLNLLFPLFLVGSIELTGAGATFPYPFYSRVFSEFTERTGIKVNYQPIGSGGGIRQLISKTVDFGATDAFMTEEELKMAKAPIVHIPTCIGAVVVSYNLPGNPQLRLTGQVLARIFLGKIKSWNDPAIKELNPGVNLPNLKITVVHRSDGSGTTYIFSEYLSKVSKEWSSKVGYGKSLNWPCGIGGKGNPGVAGLIKQIPGSIGYVELTYALQNKMPYAMIKNVSGKFIKPDIESVSKAARVKLPEDTRISLVNTQAPDGYPISSFTWLIVYKEQHYKNHSIEKARALIKLLFWVVNEGQQYAEPLGYSPLPENAREQAIELIKTITYDGKPLWNQ